jgi:hypothetical protein
METYNNDTAILESFPIPDVTETLDEYSKKMYRSRATLPPQNVRHQQFGMQF